MYKITVKFIIVVVVVVGISASWQCCRSEMIIVAFIVAVVQGDLVVSSMSDGGRVVVSMGSGQTVDGVVDTGIGSGRTMMLYGCWYE